MYLQTRRTCNYWTVKEKFIQGKILITLTLLTLSLVSFSEVNLAPSVYHINIHLDGDIHWDLCGAVIFNERFQGAHAAVGKSAITKARVWFINYKKIGPN